MRPSNSMPTTAPLLVPNCGAALEGCRSPASAIPKITAHATAATLNPTDHEDRFRIHPPICWRYCAACVTRRRIHVQTFTRDLTTHRTLRQERSGRGDAENTEKGERKT